MTQKELEIAQAACCVGTIWDQYEGTEDFDHMVRLRLNHLIELVRKSKPSLPSNLDEAAEKYSENILANNEDLQDAIEDAFKAGAEWMAGQEHHVVNLEKEIDLVWAKCNPIDEGMGVEVANIHIEAFNIIARHFFELGLNAGREKSNGVDGVVHHALKSHWIVADKNKLAAILKEFPEGAEVELFVCAKKGEKWK